ncbi:hypothetical protein [Streptomyces sp. NBC_00102]|uniref:hypothetical protein n=1 Tax=Streptomyces sp. NBC_00102 TaxID=2975652 RepID=UPI0022553471|nr:hypothetical protein [Streptomyces sp. NBC_00102]MCX5400801.1 hypothetical protein [Streptomyces sp. NBC_00102]
MRVRWYRELWDFLRTREGLGTLLIATFSAVALGVVPNVLEKVHDSIWFFLAVFVLAALLVVLGWVLRRERGLGVVVSLLPHTETQSSRFERMRDASRRNHGSALVIEPRLLSPDGAELSLRQRVDFVAKLIDARVSEYESSGARGPVTLYPLARLREGFLIGRRLAREVHPPIGVALGPESPVSGKGVLLLGPHLRQGLDHARRSLLDGLLVTGSAHPEPVPFPLCPPGDRHRLAFIVRLTPAAEMIEDARTVARTGEVRRAGTQRPHTGYVFDDADPEEPGPPCGAHVVVEAAVERLPESRELFEALATHLYEAWRSARRGWGTAVGAASVETELFLAAPMPIVMAFGVLTANDHISMVRHRLDLMNSPFTGGS